jgi:hypothetical protein
VFVFFCFEVFSSLINIIIILYIVSLPTSYSYQGSLEQLKHCYHRRYFKPLKQRVYLRYWTYFKLFIFLSLLLLKSKHRLLCSTQPSFPSPFPNSQSLPSLILLGYQVRQGPRSSLRPTSARSIALSMSALLDAAPHYTHYTPIRHHSPNGFRVLKSKSLELI